ncbi:sugar ABC transporter substrate-binding protein [Pseudarthrobacter phenanthrenivorans]|uniref:ABC transporter substrate-binding protein n=1 Tax=Pseudarthrobacter phenanthrenivorans TaxID=361575 RepID=UPI0011299577|nr:sugar ABC transporter substrate-binding protein [Pseudarthrobacter phenanthrenivorans]TPV52618.1 sugar ABC transporter substrate-binding protein [Pseudarthrobacter phenanthrenivorans]
MSTRKYISRLAIGGICTAVALAASACGAGAPASTSGTAGTNTVNVLVEAGGHAELTGVAEQCKKDAGVDVNFVELPYDGMFNRLSSEFSSGNVSFDVAALDSVWLPSFKDALQPIDEIFTDEAKKDIFPALVKEANVDGHFIGLPAWTNAEIILYRKDLFEEAKNKADFQAKYGYELAAPTTWKQYQDISEFFTKDGMYGTDVKGGVETEWLAHVLQAGGPMVLDGDKVVIDNAAHKEALDFYVSLTKSAPAGAAQVDWAAAQNLFNQGQTAMTRFWAHAYRQIPKDSPVAGKVGTAPMIAGSAGIGGVPGPWYLTVPKATKNTEAAKKFVQCAYDHNSLGIESSLGLASRISAFEKYQDKEGYESFGPLIKTLNGEATATRPATEKWQQIVDTVLVPMLQKAVAGGDSATLLADAKKQIEDLLK